MTPHSTIRKVVSALTASLFCDVPLDCVGRRRLWPTKRNLRPIPLRSVTSRESRLTRITRIGLSSSSRRLPAPHKTAYDGSIATGTKKVDAMRKTVVMLSIATLAIAGGIQASWSAETKKRGIALVHQGELVLPASGGSSETQKRKASTHDLSFTHHADKSSPVFMQKSSSNKIGTVSGNSTGRR
jgi:hypothetical protein